MSDQPLIPRLMLVTDRKRAELPLPELARQAVAGGVDAVQVREKDLSEAELLPLVQSVVDAVAGQAAVLVNGSLMVAQQLGIGLHLPETGMAPADARAALGPSALIGRSIHGPNSAQEVQGLDYLIAGHVFPTASKPNRPPLGIDGLKRISAVARAPVIAIGGIDESSIEQVMQAGAHGIAVISAINAADRPEEAARRLRDQLDRFMNGNAEQDAITVKVNGKDLALPAELTVSSFLASKGLHEKLVVVELNGTILQRAIFASTVLRSGDQVEVVHFVGGG